jgi:hypothetical protein
MPWKASSVMEERLRFVARLLDGEAMTDVCRDFGVSRKTGYKIFKKEATRPPGWNCLQQQDRFDAFVHEFNAERPHEALGMKYPAELYLASPRRYGGLPELTYPFHDRDILVTACGRLCLHRKKINISTVLAGQKLGIKEVDEGIWLASFMHYDLGHFDLEQKTLQPLDNPFGTRLSPMS